MTILIGAFGIVSLLASLVVGMTEGVLDPTKNSATLAIFFAMVTCPMMCVTAIVAAWALHLTGNNGLARIAVCLPVVNFIIIAIAYISI